MPLFDDAETRTVGESDGEFARFYPKSDQWKGWRDGGREGGREGGRDGGMTKFYQFGKIRPTLTSDQASCDQAP